MRNTAIVASGFLIRALLLLPVTAFLPGFQIWVMLVARYTEHWPEPGIMWFDWLMSIILPGYALYQTAFG